MGFSGIGVQTMASKLDATYHMTLEKFPHFSLLHIFAYKTEITIVLLPLDCCKN